MTNNASPQDGLVLLVNPLQGTASQHQFSTGNCLPLVCRPFGMTHWSPQTDEGPWLFSSEARKLQGVRATHQPSPWISDYGHFTVMAQTGPLALSAGQRSSGYRLDKAIVKPHHFRADLIRYRTTLEVTPTERCAFFRFTFPANETGRVILQPFAGQSHVEAGDDGQTLTGFTRANSGGAPNNFACYFAAVFSRPWTRVHLFHGNHVLDGTARAGDRIGAFAEFDADASPVVEMRVATSFISVEQAQRNLEREIGERGFDEIKDEGERIWNEGLGRITIEGATERQRQTFYTCLYRAQLFPRVWYEHDADDKAVHYSPYDGQIHGGVLYADNGFWDTYRTVYSLLSIIYPERLTDILNGWVNAAKEGGWFPRWSSPGYRACMIGTHMDAVIADAYVKGFRDFDIEAAYTAMLRNAFEPTDGGDFGRWGLSEFDEQGYVPADKYESATACTQDYSYNDWCIAQVAQGLGRTDDARRLLARAGNFRNVYDPGVGFMRGKNADGTWEEPWREFAWGGAYVEGGPWQSTWAVPHDPAGLIALMGGTEAFVAKLDKMLALPPHFEAGTYGFEIHEMTEMAVADFGQYAHSNQPVHHVLYLYAYAGQPWKTQQWVRRVLDELYSPDPDGLAGDEDNGEMASWYVLSALGIYPVCPGHPSYVLGAPLFPRATISVQGGNSLAITGEGNSAENVYVQDVRWNGETYGKTWVSHDSLVGGGELAFTMGQVPKTDQKYGDDDLPYSLSRETPETK